MHRSSLPKLLKWPRRKQEKSTLRKDYIASFSEVLRHLKSMDDPGNAGTEHYLWSERAGPERESIARYLPLNYLQTTVVDGKMDERINAMYRIK